MFRDSGSRKSSIDYQGSDDDIRSQIEQYLFSLAVSYKASLEPIGQEGTSKKKSL